MNKMLWALPFFLLSNSLWAIEDSGGMDGGGGGTLPAQPAQIYEIEDIATEAKPQLLYLLNGYEIRENFNTQKPLYQKLFGGTRKAQEVLKDLRLEVRKDAPCFTSDSREVDASIYGKKPNTICLSAFRISQKVDKAVVQREVLALLMHEVSHFLGSTEEEAVGLQRDIAWNIMNTKGDPLLDGERVRDAVDRFETQFGSAVEALDKADLSQTNQQLSNALASFDEWEGLTSNLTSSLFGYRERQYEQLLLLKVIWAKRYLETLIPGDSQAAALERYNQMFKGRDYFVANEIRYWPDNSPYRDEKISKLNSMPELNLLLKQLRKEYQLRSTYTYQTTFGMRWMKLDGDLTLPVRNPWEDFVGKYVVESVQRDSDSAKNNEVEFWIQKDQDHLNLRRTFNWGYGTDRIEMGAYNVNTYLNSYGETADGEVYMIQEYGGTWSNRIFVDSYATELRLKKDPTGHFTIKKTTYSFPKNMNQADEIHTCVYQGLTK